MEASINTSPPSPTATDDGRGLGIAAWPVDPAWGIGGWWGRAGAAAGGGARAVGGGGSKANSTLPPRAPASKARAAVGGGTGPPPWPPPCASCEALAVRPPPSTLALAAQRRRRPRSTGTLSTSSLVPLGVSSSRPSTRPYSKPYSHLLPSASNSLSIPRVFSRSSRWTPMLITSSTCRTLGPRKLTPGLLPPPPSGKSPLSPQEVAE
mmetsp:Transcript_18208/g.41644  ORF Transcript_18208/g.41644 Transcript_18208/m.41644 type:complete len:208 (+) Transcript_18208:146-769(+)